MTLGGKTAVITGGAGQLGRVIVKRLALEGAGIFVASHRPVETGIFGPEIAGRVRLLETDVTSEESVARMFTTVTEQAGRADILVNCAGGFAATGPLAPFA